MPRESGGLDDSDMTRSNDESQRRSLTLAVFPVGRCGFFGPHNPSSSPFPPLFAPYKVTTSKVRLGFADVKGKDRQDKHWTSSTRPSKAGQTDKVTKESVQIRYDRLLRTSVQVPPALNFTEYEATTVSLAVFLSLQAVCRQHKFLYFLTFFTFGSLYF